MCAARTRPSPDDPDNTADTPLILATQDEIVDYDAEQKNGIAEEDELRDQRQKSNAAAPDGPFVGGVKAAAAAAIQRFVAGAEARKAAAADCPATPPSCLKRIKLEPPPANFRGVGRPLKPQHTRSSGREWSSFDDDAFYHQYMTPLSPTVQPPCSRFSPREQAACVEAIGSSERVDLVAKGREETRKLTRHRCCRSDDLPAEACDLSEMCTEYDSNTAARNVVMDVRGPLIDIEQRSFLDLAPSTEAPLIDLNDSSRHKVASRTSSAIEEEFARLCFERHQVVTAPLAAEPVAQPSWQLGATSMSDPEAWKDDITLGEDADVEPPRALNLPCVADWEIPPSELKLGQKIGQGAFGDVLKGTWQGTDVAVKRLNVVVSGVLKAYEDFCHEVSLIMKLRHPNIILFMGACTVPPEICIVMEFAANGSLYGVLHNPHITIDMATVLRWSAEAARGMNYLHTRSPAVVHRDLKSVNLLVDADWHIKVSDFGLAITKQNSYAYTQVGTWGWMAPEVLDAGPYDEKADVYSFGVVLWELVTREEPFKGYHPMQIMRVIDKGERPPIPESCPPAYKNLIQWCWSGDPKSRPTFQQILEHICGMTL